MVLLAKAMAALARLLSVRLDQQSKASVKHSWLEPGWVAGQVVADDGLVHPVPAKGTEGQGKEPLRRTYVLNLSARVVRRQQQGGHSKANNVLRQGLFRTGAVCRSGTGVLPVNPMQDARATSELHQCRVVEGLPVAVAQKQS